MLTIAPRRRVIALLINNAGLRDDYQGDLRRGVEQVCIDLVALRYVGRDRIGQVSKAIQGVGTTTFARDPVPPDAKLVLDNYKRVGLVV